MPAVTFWPAAEDYRQAIANLPQTVADAELSAGRATLNARRKPILWSGNFAVVFRIECPQTANTWALKCFTKPSAGQRERYRQIAIDLARAKLPFVVDFKYLDEGIRVRDQWFPALKMRWVEGLTLNKFVEERLHVPRDLKAIIDLWVKLAARLRESGIAHADLQHGNILLVPADDRSLALRLIDYDGMYVPSLAGTRSGEAGHPAFQHPQRLREGNYSADVDRFSHLVICTAVWGLMLGRSTLWEQFNNGDNLLFREADFQRPGESALFHELWNLGDPNVRGLTGRLMLACQRPMNESPWLGEVVVGSRVTALDQAERRQIEALLESGRTTIQSRPAADTPGSLAPVGTQPATSVTVGTVPAATPTELPLPPVIPPPRRPSGLLQTLGQAPWRAVQHLGNFVALAVRAIVGGASRSTPIPAHRIRARRRWFLAVGALAIFAVTGVGWYLMGRPDPAESVAVGPKSLPSRGGKRALKFGGQQRAVVPNRPALNPAAITVEAWVNFDRLAGRDLQFPVCKGGDRVPGSYTLLLIPSRSGQVDLGFQLKWRCGAYAPAQLQTGRWYHVAGTYDGDLARFYLDGKLHAENKVGKVPVGNNSPLYFSFNDVGGFPYYLSGQLAEVRIWDRARTAEEILSTMNAILSGNEPNLVAYWDFGEANNSQTVVDRSANHCDGHLGSSPLPDRNDPLRVER